MRATLPIGDFARATHLSVKTLRHYHQMGLLEPADIHPDTGYRRYTTDQIPTAQVIRRFRGLGMSLEAIRGVLDAPDLQTRNDRIAAHLDRLEDDLAQTESAVKALRDLLQNPAPATPIELRRIEATPAAAITEVIDVQDVSSWYQGALGELRATLGAQRIPTTGPAGGIFANELFTVDHGEATIFLPCRGLVRELGRVVGLVVPAVELAVAVHPGSPHGIDRTYGSLATYVTQHALAVDGPIREYYLIDRSDTPDESAWRTEIGWPIFHTGIPG